MDSSKPDEEETKAARQQRLLGDLQSPWPFLSELDAELSAISAGAHWPWKKNMAQRIQEPNVESLAGPAQIWNGQATDVKHLSVDLEKLDDLDMAVVARVASSDRRTARKLFQILEKKQGLVSKMSTGTLVSMLDSVCNVDLSIQRTWLPVLCRELLQRKPLRARHALVLLAAMKAKEAFEGEVPLAEVLETVLDALLSPAETKELENLKQQIEKRKAAAEQAAKKEEQEEAEKRKAEAEAKQKEAEALTTAQILPAMESLAVASRCQELPEVAARLTALLGPKLVQLLVSTKSDGLKSQALRFLAAWARLPEPLALPGKGPCLAVWLARLSGVRYRRDALVVQETAAAAAFTLSRCGAWSSGSAGYLLMQALRRDLEVGAELPRQILDAEKVSPVAGSWWLAAVAMSGVELEACCQPEEWAQKAPEVLLAAVAQLSTPGEASQDGDQESKAADDQAADDQAAADQAAADQAAEDQAADDQAADDQAAEDQAADPFPHGQSEAHQRDVPHADAARTLWALHALGKSSEDLAEKLLADLAAADATGFSGETWQFLRELQPLLAKEDEACPFAKWRDALATSAEAEQLALQSSPRWQELQALEALPEAEGVEMGALVGPFCLPLVWRKKNLAIDIDFHHCVVNRVLRRQQWASVAPDWEVKEIGLADWEKAGRAGRAKLLRDALG